MSDADDGENVLPDLIVVEGQVAQFHSDLGALIAAGLAITDSSDWMTSVYSGLLARARKAVNPALLSHLGDPDEAGDLKAVFIATGQIAAVLAPFVGAIGRQGERPIGFRPSDDNS
jgi:hypothetical protein